MHYLFCLLLSTTLGALAAAASDQPLPPVSISPASLPIKYENVIETVLIGGTHYQVPEPWAGNRLFPTSRTLEELRQIPVEYTHQGTAIHILATAYPALIMMLDQAGRDGIDLQVESAYRSINYQTRIFTRMLDEGRTFDDIVRYVAPPGYSQHMLGTAMDFYPSNWEFAESAQYRWLREHARKFGFEETYSRYNRFQIPWEAWHWNYVGGPVWEAEVVMEKAAGAEDPALAGEAPADGTAEAENLISN